VVRVKRRDPNEGMEPFLERSAAWWRERTHLNPQAFSTLLSYAGVVLARLGELRPDEVARLERIAEGAEVHPRVGRDQAARTLVTWRARPWEQGEDEDEDGEGAA
jgi:hypothetical protein